MQTFGQFHRERHFGLAVFVASEAEQRWPLIQSSNSLDYYKKRDMTWKKFDTMTTRQYDHVVKKGVSESLKSGFQLTQEMEIEHQTKLGFFVTFLKHQKHVVPIIFCKITVVTLIEHLLWQKTLNDIKNNESAVCLHFSWLFTWFCLWYSFHSRYESPFLQHTSELGQPLELKLLSIWSLAPEQCSPKTSCSSKKLHLSFLWILLFLSKLTKMTPIIGPNMIQM